MADQQQPDEPAVPAQSADVNENATTSAPVEQINAIEGEEQQPVGDEPQLQASPSPPPPEASSPSPTLDTQADNNNLNVETSATIQSICSDELEITTTGAAVDIQPEAKSLHGITTTPPPLATAAAPEPPAAVATAVAASIPPSARTSGPKITASQSQPTKSEPGISPSAISPQQPEDGRSPLGIDGETASSSLLEAPHNSGEKEIVPFFSIGAQCDANNVLHFLDNNTILYGCGAHFVIHNIEQKFQKFIPLPRAAAEINAVALDLQHHMLAFAEASADEGRQPTVYIYDVLTIKRRKTMCVGDGKATTHQWIAFTPDGKMLATLGGAPDFTLQLWNWEKSRIFAQTRIAALAYEVKPRSSTEFLVFGPKILRIYLLRETGLKLVGQTEKFRNVNILSAEWCGESVLVSVEHGKTFLWNPKENTMVAFHDKVTKLDQAFVGVPAHLRESMHAEETAAAAAKSTAGSKSSRNISMAAAAASAAAAEEQNAAKDLFYLHGSNKCLKIINETYLACVVGHHGVQLWRKKISNSVTPPSQPTTMPGATKTASVRASKTAVRNVAQPIQPAPVTGQQPAFEFELVEQYKISHDEKRYIDRQKITMLSISPDGQRIVCSTDKNQIYLCEIPKPDASPTTGKPAALNKQQQAATLKQSTAQQRRSSSSPDSPTEAAAAPSQHSPGGGIENSAAAAVAMANFDRHPIREMRHMSMPFHSGHISSIDVAVKKPLLATACGDDNSVRIWNFQTRTIEVIKIFEESPLSVAVHPSGHYVLVGFAERLVLMYLMRDDLRTVKEFSIRGCRECAFANGGHLFAALNGNVIQIYSAIQFEGVAQLRGHNSRVKCLKWARSDQTLVTCSQDGAVYEWDVHTGRRVSESVLKAVNYNAVAVSPDTTMIYAVGSDMMLREIRDSQIQREIPQETVLTALVLSPTGRVMAAGTETGMLRMFRYPSLPPDWWNTSGIVIPLS